MIKFGRLLAAVGAALVLGAGPSGPTTGPAPNPLERYVARPDPSYGWTLAKTIPGQGYTAYVLDLTSQTWRKPGEVDRTVWKHWLTIVKPDRVLHDEALLYINGGDNGDPAPTTVPDRALQLALNTNSVVADLGMVPNQPLRFSDSPTVARYEDDMIAHVQNKQLATGDDEWILRMAMVKSGVRAMDAMQAFMAGETGGRVKLNKFVVSGGSKRGWTSWLVAAVDPRVIAVMPVVIDVLNTDPVTKHHYEALGYFSPALGDYVNHGIIPDRVGSPAMNATRNFEDPYAYRNRAAMRMPKYMINASGDQFFLPDNSQYYWGGLKEEKRLRYVPNARHNLGGTDAVDSMVAFYHAILTDTPRPEYSWTKNRDGSLTVRSKTRPREVNLWAAHNPNARDFRLDTLGPAYRKTRLQPQRNGSWIGRPPRTETGFTAFFVELVYDGPAGKQPFKFTTEVSVVPDTKPYKWADALKRPRSTPEERRALTRPEGTPAPTPRAGG